MRPTHLSLFSGIGGLDLAAEAAGFMTVGQCEFADYPTRVLEKHWPGVPRWRDIRTLTKESFYERTGLRTVDVVSGGFPCQPFSVAGKQKGKGDDHYLWPEMLRVIRALAPRWVVGENVPGILRIAAGNVVKDLEREGFDVVVFDFEAAAVGTPHRRERIAFVAHAGGAGLQGREQHGAPDAGEREPESSGPAGERGQTVRDADSRGCDRDLRREYDEKPENGCRRPAQFGLGGVVDGFPDWVDEPAGIPRIITGVPHRADRLKCLGNAVVPQQFYPIFRAIMEEIR